MFSIQNALQQTVQSDKQVKESEETEIKIKLQICNLLNFLLDERQDHLVQNCIAWFETLGKDFPKDVGNKKAMTNFKKKYDKKIKEEIYKIFPDIMKTGLEKIDDDEKYFPKKDRKFEKFDSNIEITKDFNHLFTGKKSKGVM
jgi:inositol 1,4,5-triphosphate receptor type 1/inositol 1,4,5-triphosphate receptor type 3